MSLPIPPKSRYGWKGYKYGRKKRSSLSEALLSLDFDGEFIYLSILFNVFKYLFVSLKSFTMTCDVTSLNVWENSDNLKCY